FGSYSSSMEALDGGLRQREIFPIFIGVIAEQDIVAVLVPTQCCTRLRARDRVKQREVYSIGNNTNFVTWSSLFHFLGFDYDRVSPVTHPATHMPEEDSPFAQPPLSIQFTEQITSEKGGNDRCCPLQTRDQTPMCVMSIHYIKA